ncbi:MAG: RNase adapter RapZ [Gammaproteobacteria bacterium]|nr:RNase adapter RapZ [Gammaproteobacteria bacterium]
MSLLLLSFAYKNSGSGKTSALQALEDLDYYCIDNLPLSLLSAFAAQMIGGVRRVQRAAVGIDARNLSEDFRQFPALIEELRGSGLSCEILFLDADDKTLIKRFSETRRKHPLTRLGGSLPEAIAQERKLLEPMAAHAARLDTKIGRAQLRERVRERVEKAAPARMSLLLLSFAYKNGIPSDADLVFDLRCLPNPHWQPELRPLTGRDEAVARYLEAQPQVTRMYQTLRDFLLGWLPLYESEPRSYMTVALGCTGGRHRSVYFSEKLADHFRQTRDNVLVRHRDLA